MGLAGRLPSSREGVEKTEFFLIFADRPDPEAEGHVVPEPHREIGPPDVVVQIEMDSAAHPRQAVVKIQQRRRSRRNKRRIQILNARLIVEQHLFDRMEGPSSTAYDIRWSNPLLHLLEHAVPPSVCRDKGEPCGMGQTVRNFGKPFQPDLQIILLIRQNVIDLNASESRMFFRGKGDAAAVAPERFVDVGLEPFELLLFLFLRADRAL